MTPFHKAPAFHRPARKPKMYGPPSVVQASIFKNAERRGINPQWFAFSVWCWGPGQQLNYATFKPVTTNTGVYGNNALVFDGTSQQIEDTNLSGFNAQKLTVVIQHITPPSLDDYEPLISKYYDNDKASWALNRANTTDTYGRFYVWDGGLQDVPFNTIFDGNEHINICTADGSYVRGYQDGIAVTPNAYSNAITYNTGSLVVAYYPVLYLPTTIKQISILTNALTADQAGYWSDNPYFLLQRVAPVYYSIPLTLNLTQYAFRFRNDDGNESAATFAADENTNITLTPGSKTRIRIGVSATGDPTSKQFQFEYRRKPSGGSFGDWGKVESL